MRALGYVDNGKPDWKRLLREADIGTGKDVLKQRWNEGAAPRDRAKIRARLLEVDARRKDRERTPIGRRLLALDEWQRIGENLVLDVAILEEHIERLRPLAEHVKRKHDGQQLAAQAQAEIDRSMAAFSAPVPAARGTRK